jgi:hypothetical protein
MSTKPDKSKLGAFTRSLIVLPALAVGLSLAFTGAASAQTTVASVDNLSTNGPGNPGVPCPNQFYCGTANIPGYGAAFWSFNSPNPNPTPDGPDCYDYTGTSTLTLLNYPTFSQLVLNETNEHFCFPGNSGNTPNFWKNWTNTYGHHNPYGHPNRGGGNWSVCNANTANSTTGCGGNTVSSGAFQNWTGSGTDSLQSNGARITATWVGTVTSSQ